MKRLHLPVIGLLLSLFIHTTAFAATLAGVIRDDSGAAIPGVTVTATRTGEAAEPQLAVTDGEGMFRVADLPPGTYKLEAILDGFQTISKDVKLVTGQTVDLAFKLVPAFGETVEVVAETVRTGEVAVLDSRRESAVVSDSISAEEIRKTPDSTAAGVVERLTGVTLIGDKYVFVRGLGERYSGTTINGSSLPTTETEKRVVPLDLFPAKLLETVNVVKTYTPDKPGDFGSGVVEMTTTEFPSGQSFKLSVGTGYHSAATGEPFRRYAGGLDRMGGGGQKISSTIPSGFLRRSSILDPGGFTPQELEAFGEALVGNWTGDQVSSAKPATDASLTYGNTFGRLGIVLSGVSTHGYEVVDEEYRFFGVDAGQLVPINDYDLLTNREHTSTGFIGNLSYRLADNHRVFLNSVLTRDASAEDRFQEGLQTSTGGDIRDFRVRYQLEQIFSTRLRGEHNLQGPGMGSLLEWNLTRSTASNDSDLRENLYRESNPGVFELQTGFAESGRVEYFELADQIQQGGLAYSIYFAPDGGTWSGSIKGGLDHMQRTRDFDARRFRFVQAGSLQVDLSQTPDEIFTAANIGPNGFEIREVTGVNDAYDAEHIVDAAFLMSDTTFGKWRIIGGARFEKSDQSVLTFNPFDVENIVESVNESSDVLPSINVVYQLAQRTNLRFGYGRSLNRPEFRELSPFTFTEVAGGRSVSGNPDLVQATLDGFDVRWETFPGAGDVIAASAFYKKIDSPIERIVQPTTDLRQSFVNADSATLYGLELEFRRSLESILPALRLWSINLNYAYINSDVTIGEHQQSVVTNKERPLEGQSDQIVNLGLQFYQPQWGTMVRFLGSHSGERLTEVGAFGLPDIYEAASTSLDVVLSQSLGPFAKGLEVKLAGTNLLNAKREFIQGGEIQRRYDPGRKVSLSLSYSPF
ncbi:MAG TPA: TonB-dependent receptor [Thermoanaerobaculia bacterium]|jgi:outer membrane receptor protein involved in Fe transport|nr:TonB-dependent receptor [Thermoanaerobaculia bacterium]